MTDEEIAKQAEMAAETEGEVITVTGSLIDRKQLTTAAPLTVLDKKKLDAAGITSLGMILQQIPAQGNAINAQQNNAGDGSVRISLRSLGDQRTLVLLNGRRVVPGGLGADSSADLGSIPLAMIERVEVLKDGASAIYGSDAIAGVVNIITRTDFEGTEGTVYTGVSPHGDGLNYDLSFVTGESSKKGNITFAAGYQDQRKVMGADRVWGNTLYDYDFDNKVPIPGGSSSTPGGRLDQTDLPPGSVPGCTDDYCTYDTKTKMWRDFIPADENGFGDTYNFQPLNYLFTPSKRINLMATGHHQLTENVNAFFEAMYTNRRSDQQLASTPMTTGLFGTPITADNIYNPFGADIISYNRRMVEFGPRAFHQNVDTKRLVVGVDGKLDKDFGPFDGWKWEGSFNYGRTDAVELTEGNLILSHLANALGPSFYDANGTPTCGTPTAPIDGCVPLNILVPGNVTKEMKDYLTFTGANAGFNEQRSTQLTAHGKVADLPNHGDVSVAVGGDYRFERGRYSPDPLTASGDTTGNAIAPVQGSYNAYEGFGEVSVVPIAQQEWAKWVEINAAARGYKFRTFGSGATYKAGALWTTKGGLSLRGTYGTAFRAPSISQLYSGASDDFQGVEDPCDTQPPSAGGMTVTLDPDVAAECAKEGVPVDATFGTDQQRAKVGGNPKLTAETAKIATGGVVYEPLAGLAFTLDYWQVHIDHAIEALGSSVIFSNCYHHGQCNDTFGRPLIVRDPTTHEISRINDTLANVGIVTTSGIDFAALYTWKHPDAGEFHHTLEGTYMFKYDLDTGLIGDDGKTQTLHGKGNYDLGHLPALKMNLLTSWAHKSGMGGGFNIRYVDSLKECYANACNDDDTQSRKIDAYVAGDLYVSYTAKSTAGTTNVTLGVNNITEAHPPWVYANTTLSTDETAYDLMGRYVYLRVSQLY